MLYLLDYERGLLFININNIDEIVLFFKLNITRKDLIFLLKLAQVSSLIIRIELL